MKYSSMLAASFSLLHSDSFISAAHIVICFRTYRKQPLYFYMVGGGGDKTLYTTPSSNSTVIGRVLAGENDGVR